MNNIEHIRVLTVQIKPSNDLQYSAEANRLRKWGVKGTLVRYSNSHGLCFEVQHDDGSRGCYEPEELKLIDPEDL